jgi:RNA polymerase sigma-70 factor (sigma-E family)
VPQIHAPERLVGEEGVVSEQADDYASFVRASGGSLFGTAVLLTGDEGEAEELVQDALTHLYPKWAAVMAATSPVAYVRRSLVNRFLSRQRSMRVSVPLSTIAEPMAPDPLVTVLDRTMLADSLARLSARQRGAIVLRYYHDQSDPEIAVLLGCRQATVRSLISRGLTTMRGQLQPVGSGRSAS